MILGASHLTLASQDAPQAARALEDRGFTLDFTDPRVVNSPEKQPLLSASGRAAKTIGIRYFKGRAGPAVELLSYPTAGPDHPSRFIPEFVDGSLVGVTCPVDDLRKAEGFWREAGLKPAGGGMLELTAPLPQWRLRLTLRKEEAGVVPGLDSLGYHCLSLLSSDIDADLKRLSASTLGEASVPFDVVVNQKTLRAAMVRGPGGGLVELIEVRR